MPVIDDITGPVDDAHSSFAELIQKLERPNPSLLHGRDL